MSPDFFTALIGRHAGTARTVEPRIGSRYEVTQVGGLPEFERSVHPAARSATEAQPAPRTDPERAIAHPAPTNRADPSPRRAVREPDAGPAGRPPGDRIAAFAGVDADSSGALDRPAPAPLTETPDRYDESRRLEALLAHLQALAHPRGPQPDQEGPSPEAQPAAWPNAGRVERATAGIGEAPTGGPQRRSGESPLPGQLSSEPARSAADPAPGDWLAALQDRLSQRRDSAERGSEPVVNVTIGRVEVKAVREAGQTAARPRKAPAIMSLDDYLARREQRS